MLKVVVFDSGWGGELVSNFLLDELGVVDVIRVIDWDHAPYEGKNLSEVCRLSKLCLRAYIGKVDLIILGGYVVSLAQDYLERQFPRQKFIGMGVNYYRILNTRNFPDRVIIMTNELLFETKVREEVCQNLPYSTIILPDCSGWNKLINTGEMTMEILRNELGAYFALRQDKACPTLPPPPDAPGELIHADVILLLNTHFWEIKPEIEQLFGFGVPVMDFRQKLLHDTCRALNLRGVDGCRSK